MFYCVDELEVLYEAVKKLAFKILPERKDDLTQEVIIKLWSRRKHIPASFGRSYLRTVVQSSAADLFRKEGKARCFAYSMNDDGSLAIAGQPERRVLAVAEPNADYDNIDHLAQTRKVLDSLSQAHREVLELRGAGYSYAEIAAQTSLPIGTVRTRLLHARKRLAKLIRQSQSQIS